MSMDESGMITGFGGAAVSVGSAAAQGGMNPMADISAVISLVGLGTSIFGSKKSSDATAAMAGVSQKEADASSQIATYDKQINDQRKQQMVLTASRQQLQTIRNTQLARSMALTASTSQGANFGSGLQGGLGQISADSNTSLLGVNQNLEIGKNIFGLGNQIDDQKILLAQYGAQMAKLQGKAAMGAGLSSLGAGISKAAPGIGTLSGNLFGNSGPSQSSMGGGFGGAKWDSSGAKL